MARHIRSGAAAPRFPRQLASRRAYLKASRQWTSNKGWRDGDFLGYGDIIQMAVTAGATCDYAGDKASLIPPYRRHATMTAGHRGRADI